MLVFGGGDFERRLSDENEASRNGVSDLTKEFRELSLPLCHLKPRGRPSPEPDYAGTPLLDIYPPQL